MRGRVRQKRRREEVCRVQREELSLLRRQPEHLRSSEGAAGACLTRPTCARPDSHSRYASFVRSFAIRSRTACLPPILAVSASIARRGTTWSLSRRTPSISTMASSAALSATSRTVTSACRATRRNARPARPGTGRRRASASPAVSTSAEAAATTSTRARGAKINTAWSRRGRGSRRRRSACRARRVAGIVTATIRSVETTSGDSRGSRSSSSSSGGSLKYLYIVFKTKAFLSVAAARSPDTPPPSNRSSADTAA